MDRDDQRRLIHFLRSWSRKEEGGASAFIRRAGLSRDTFYRWTRMNTNARVSRIAALRVFRHLKTTYEEVCRPRVRSVLELDSLEKVLYQISRERRRSPVLLHRAVFELFLYLRAWDIECVTLQRKDTAGTDSAVVRVPLGEEARLELNFETMHNAVAYKMTKVLKAHVSPVMEGTLTRHTAVSLKASIMQMKLDDVRRVRVTDAVDRSVRRMVNRTP